jgi:hypothetical protein
LEETHILEKLMYRLSFMRKKAVARGPVTGPLDPEARDPKIID